MINKLLLVCAALSCALAHQHHDHAVSSKPEPSAKPQPPAATPKPGSPTKPSAPGPVTVTPAGAVRGSWMDSRLGRRFQAYRGIRYAQPPVGELRFQPPVDMTTYPSEVDASADGPACPLPVEPGEYYVDEDCLRINVYTPGNNSGRKLPVIFFIHPGGFYSMTGRSDLFGPDYLLDRDIVLVTINYRLASLGFLSTGDAVAPGNNGYKDQVSALRWVKRNIAAFGGDPGKVTIAGCSAGSISVMLHMISPMSKGLFHRGIAMSASPMGKEPLPSHQMNLAQKQAKILNCPTNSSRAIVDCLKTKSWQEMGNSLLGFWDQFGFDPIGFWNPVVEPDVGQPRFLAVQPDEAVRKGHMHAVPLLISQTEDEFYWKAFSVTKNKTVMDRMNAEWEKIAPISFALPEKNSAAASRRLKEVYLSGKPVTNTPKSNKDLGKLYGDSWIGLNVHRMANLMCRHSPQPVWYSVFSYIGNNSFYEDPQTGKPAGAAHHDDLIYLFSMSYFRTPIKARSPPLPAPQDHIIVERMTAIWYTFAKHGDPNPREAELPELSSLHWPAMKPEDRKYLKVDRQFSVHEKLHENQLQVWDELYPMQF
ncbi:esterase E4-like isoform X2 [Leguminivora glycinivorella]|uniref:esterase E4-like isoform X2 n=1 Tax=Leguminivora glycinivorella TaxID=1035111 RepID=UPI00200FA93D|nr:esterase E4-like isoform X2 [Leguminivora glycinivorella]